MVQSTGQATIGYYTVLEDEQTGWTGGLLLLNRAGRPLEFQCSLPVRPTRAHEILFGPTLRAHLIGEVIGSVLIKKCRTPISLLCCDQPESLKLATETDGPVALVAEAAEVQEGPIAAGMLAGAGTLGLAGATLHLPMEQIETVRELLPEFEDLPDAVEPFERIREAVREAHSQLARSANQAA